MKEFNFSLDLTNKKDPNITLVKGEIGVGFNIRLTHMGNLYPINNDNLIIGVIKKADGKECVIKFKVENASLSRITGELSQQCTNVSGNVNVEVQVFTGASVVKSWTFSFTVKEDIGETRLNSSDEYKGLMEVVNLLKDAKKDIVTKEDQRTKSEVSRELNEKERKKNEINRINSEQKRKDDFDQMVEAGVFESNIADKLTELENNYAPELTNVKTQLAETQSQFNQVVGAVTEDSEVVLARSEYTTLKERLDAEKAEFSAHKDDYALKTKYFPLIKKEKTRSGTVNTIRPQLYHNNELYLTLGNIIYKTTDVAASLSPAYTFASGVSLASLIRTSAGTWLALYTQSGIRKIARSTDFVNWTVVLDNITSGMIGSLGWDSGNGKVLYGEYTTDTTTDVPTIKLYASLDDGITWNVVKTWQRIGVGSIRHIHCVRYDKYSQRFWIATGDALSESFIYSTTDGSALTTELAADASLTAVSLAFDKRYVFWGKDLQTADDFTIHAFNKNTKKVKDVGIVNNVVYDIIKHPKGYLMIDQAEDAPQRGVFSNSVYVYFSYDGFTWQRVYEIPLNDGDTHYVRNYALSEDGSKLTWMREYKQGAGAYQFYIETISLTF